MSTEIQWTDETWNPVTGCSKVSPGCAHCYAETVALRFWATQYRPMLSDGSGKTIDTISTSHHEDYLAQGLARPRTFTDVMCHEDRLDQPLRWKRPRKVFVNSMSDLFHEDVPDEFIDRVFAVMALAPQHTFQVLTKRAARMRAYLSADKLELLDRFDAASDDWTHGTCGDRWPLPNVWLGVSVENQHFADERIPLLLQTPAALRFISAEPLLGSVDLTPWLIQSCCGNITDGDTQNGEPPQCCGDPYEPLDWIIVGGESGHGARPMDVAWARSIVTQCKAAGVVCFMKQLGSHPIAEYDGEGEHAPGSYFDWLTKDRKGGTMAEWPADLRVREFPMVPQVKVPA